MKRSTCAHLVAALAACVFLASAPGKSDVKTIVVHTLFHTKEAGPMGAEQLYLEVDSAGAWKTVEVRVGKHETVTATQSGDLSADDAENLFKEAEKAIASGMKTKPLPAKGGGDKTRTVTLALFGLGKKHVYITPRGGKAPPAFKKILALLKKSGLTFTKQAGAKKTVEYSSYTMAGEGASSSFVFDSAGNFTSTFSGDIGCGYDDTRTLERSVPAKITAETFKKLVQIVKEKKLATKKSGTPDTFAVGGESTFTLKGFGSKDITVQQGEGGHDELYQLLTTFHFPGAQTGRFLVSRIEYNGKIQDGWIKVSKPGGGFKKLPKLVSVSGKLHASGLWVVEKGKGKATTKLLPAKKVQKIFNVVQAAVDRARAEKDEPGTLGKIDEGVQGMFVYAFGVEDERYYLNSHLHEDAFLSAKKILDAELGH